MKILIVEDELKAIQTLRQGFEELKYQVDSAQNGEIAFNKIVNLHYDVVISDIVMPTMSGLQLLKRMHDSNIKTPILILSALTEIDDKLKGFELGADDYLEKPFEFRELVARVQALHRRHIKRTITPSHIQFADVELFMSTKEIKRNGVSIELTPKEFALMQYFMLNEGRVISKKEIAEKVWDIFFDTNTNIIEVYINYLRNKIDKPFEEKLIHTVHGLGYILKRSVL